MQTITENNFTFKNVLKEMVVLELGKETITMNEILKYVEIHGSKPFTLTYKNSKNHTFILNCYDVTVNHFSFELGETKGVQIYKNPIKYLDSKNKLWEFICIEQIHYFLNFFNCPMIECKKEKIKIPPTLLNMISHFIHGDKIVDAFTYEIYDKKSFVNFFKTCPNDFLNETFESPIKFDKNFDYYFNYKKINKIIGSFHIYDDIKKTRYFLSRDFLDLNKPSPYYYYGASGKGKSITLIGSLKYRNDMTELGTFYINCKSLKRHLFDRNELHTKQILINEILYLNPHSYSTYEQSVNYIKCFLFKNDYAYLSLIDNLLEKFTYDNFEYLIAFDQYDNSQDPTKILGKILKKYKEKKNIHFIILSSIDDIDIRKIKLHFLFSEDIPDKEHYNEIKEICEIKDINLDSEQQEALNMLGNSFKVLNEIKNAPSIEIYLKKKKFKYSKKIILFYLSDKSKINEYIDTKNQIIKRIPFDIIGKIISFKTNYIYDKRNIINIADSIPFRFYNVEKVNENSYIINFAFPLIKEIMSDIYAHITLNNNYSSLKNILNNKGSGLGTIFELKIIFSLYEGKKLFDFTINKKFAIHTIIPKTNENIITNIRFSLEDNNTYVVSKEIFNCKALDFLIIRVINKEIFIYGFQISIFKDEIFNESYLNNAYKDMIDNLDLIFSADINYNNTFFGYIFDYSRVKEKDYVKMLKKCENKGWQYCFFDTDENIFCDKNHEQITNINSIVSCPLTEEEKIYPTIKSKLTKNELIEIKIKPLISNEKNFEIKELKYIGKLKGPLFGNEYINILEKPSGTKLIFLNDNLVIMKFIENNTLEVFGSFFEEGYFDVYTI